MMKQAVTSEFTIGEKVTNQRGAWVVLRLDVNAGVLHSGIYYAEAWAPDFPADLESCTLTPNRFRSNVERGMRQWLAGR